MSVKKINTQILFLAPLKRKLKDHELESNLWLATMQRNWFISHIKLGEETTREMNPLWTSCKQNSEKLREIVSILFDNCSRNVERSAFHVRLCNIYSSRVVRQCESNPTIDAFRGANIVAKTSDNSAIPKENRRNNFWCAWDAIMDIKVVVNPFPGTIQK